jgi:hypothetical protein
MPHAEPDSRQMSTRKIYPSKQRESCDSIRFAMLESGAAPGGYGAGSSRSRRDIRGYPTTVTCVGSNSHVNRSYTPHSIRGQTKVERPGDWNGVALIRIGHTDNHHDC